MEQNLESSYDKLKEKLLGWVDALILNLPNFLFALLVFSLAYWLSRNLQVWTNRYLKKVVSQASVRSLLANLVAILVVIIGLILALSILHLEDSLKSLLAGAGVAGLAISLALQGTLSNTFSGIFIAIKDELNIGDFIETNGYSGTVEEISLRFTKIKESDNNIVVVPNKLIHDSPFKNLGLTKRIRTTITCGIAYDSDLRAVKKIAIDAIENHYPPGNGEEIEFYYTDFGDSAIDFMLRFWVDAQEGRTALEVTSEAIMIIKETFDENDIAIPYPIRTVINNSM